MKLADLLRTKNLFIDGVSKEILKRINESMWDAYDLYRDDEKLAQCVSALVGLLALLGGRQNFARIIAAAIRDPAVDPNAKAKLLGALIQMQVAVDAARERADTTGLGSLSDSELEAELKRISEAMKARRARVMHQPVPPEAQFKRNPKSIFSFKQCQPVPRPPISRDGQKGKDST